MFDSYQQARVAIERIGELLATPTTVPPPAEPVMPGRLRGEVVLDDVHFKYSSAIDEALRGVDLRIAPGETVALVGETGAGKSTVMKLVARFYDPTSGAVRVDGVAIDDYDPVAFHQQLGVVPQEAFLFSGTIRDNIAYGRKEATDAEVEAAAREVGAHDFIASLPGGYLQWVSERGRSLSSGQRQLIALARAHLVDPGDPAARRGDVEPRPPDRGEGAGGDGCRRARPHDDPDRAPAADRAARRPHRRRRRGRVVESGSHDELLARGSFYSAHVGRRRGRARATATAPDVTANCDRCANG